LGAALKEFGLRRSVALEELHSLRKRAAIAGLDVEFDLLALDERTTAIGLNFGVVNKHVWLAIARDETPALLVVKPLHSS
jgi:hypothetical protein